MSLVLNIYDFLVQSAAKLRRIIGKISALTILQYVNFINDKPIGRIKYALN